MTTIGTQRRRHGALLTLLFAVFSLGILLPTSALADEVNVEGNDFYVAGNVKNDSQPLADVRIVVTGAGYEAEVVTDEDGRWKVGVPTKDPYQVQLDEESLPDGVVVEGENPVTSEFGAQAFRPINFFLGEGVRITTSFFDQFIERTINGLNFGLMLALAAIGLSLVFGTTGLSNFAHAEAVTFGAVMAMVFSNILHLPLWISLPLAIAASAVLGWLMDVTLWQPLRRKRVGVIQLMIFTIGLSLAARYVFQFFIGGGTHQLPGAGGRKIQILGPIQLSVVDMVSMAVSVLVLLGVAWWLLRTRVGKATRAISDNRALAAATGIDVDRVTRIVWIFGTALAGLSGILWAYFRPGLKWDMGMQLLLLMFAAVCLGGLGTAFGALIGSIIVGLLVELSTLWIPSDLKYVGALLVLVLVLLLRPQGILGRRERIG